MHQTSKHRRSTGSRYVTRQGGSRKTHKRNANRANRRYNRDVARDASRRS